MKSVLALILLLTSVSAFAGRSDQPADQRSKTTITTNDNRVIYSASDNRLYSVQNQTVCKEVNGKKECHGRGVATLIPRGH